MRKNLFKSLKAKISQKKQLQFLDDASVIEKTEVLFDSYFIIILICSVISMLVIASMMIEMDEIAKTQGEVVPKVKVQSLRNPASGIVKKVYVHNGKSVKKGQLLIEFDPTSLQAELDKGLIEVISLQANLIRLQTIKQGKKLNDQQLLDHLKSKIYLTDIDSKSVEALLSERAILSTIHQLTDEKELDLIHKQIDQSKIELKSKKQNIAVQTNLLKIVEEEFQLYKILQDKDLASKRELLSTTRVLLNIQKDHMQSQSDYNKQKQYLAELQAKLEHAKQVNALDISKQINEVNAEFLKAKQHVIKLQNEISTLKIKAPYSGTIKGLNVFEGGAVSANEELVTIVPSNGKMMVETRILSRDIGHVYLNAPVKVKISTYDYIRFGFINGTLDKISATTYIDEHTQQAYYLGTIKLSRNSLTYNNKSYPLRSGMLAEVDILTGKKSLFEYLLKPIHLSLGNAFQER